MSWHKQFEDGGEQPLSVQAAREDGAVRVRVGDRSHRAEVLSIVDGVVRFALDGAVREAVAVTVGDELHVRLDGRTWRLPLHQGRARGAGAAGDGRITAPMTGTVLQVNVAVGDEVAADQTVAVLTAMKMEHKLSAGVDGTVAEVGSEPGATVEQGSLLVRIEPRAE